MASPNSWSFFVDSKSMQLRLRELKWRWEHRLGWWTLIRPFSTFFSIAQVFNNWLAWLSFVQTDYLVSNVVQSVNFHVCFRIAEEYKPCTGLTSAWWIDFYLQPPKEYFRKPTKSLDQRRKCYSLSYLQRYVIIKAADKSNSKYFFPVYRSVASLKTNAVGEHPSTWRPNVVSCFPEKRWIRV